jgi:hypothetical protein
MNEKMDLNLSIASDEKIPTKFEIHFDEIPFHLHKFLELLVTQKSMWLNPFLCRIDSVEIVKKDGKPSSLAWTAFEENCLIQKLQHELSGGERQISIDVCFPFFNEPETNFVIQSLILFP